MNRKVTSLWHSQVRVICAYRVKKSLTLRDIQVHMSMEV